MSTLQDILNPADHANACIKATGKFFCKWTGSVKENGYLTKISGQEHFEYRFQFIGNDTGVKINVAFSNKWHPSIEPIV